MIIGIGGWERCFKTGLGAVLATYPEEFNIPGYRKYNIKQGFGNLHLFKTPYPWEYLETKDLVETIRRANENKVTDTLFFIDEADQVYNPRDFKSQEQTKNLKGIGQHAKLGNVYIYTYQLGQPDDMLLGVDKILRSNTRLEFEMRYLNFTEEYVIYRLKNRMLPDAPESTGLITDISKYYDLWNYQEPVI